MAQLRCTYISHKFDTAQLAYRFIIAQQALLIIRIYYFFDADELPFPFLSGFDELDFFEESFDFKFG